MVMDSRNDVVALLWAQTCSDLANESKVREHTRTFAVHLFLFDERGTEQDPKLPHHSKHDALSPSLWKQMAKWSNKAALVKLKLTVLFIAFTSIYLYTTLPVLALVFSNVNAIKSNPRQQIQYIYKKKKLSRFTFQCMEWILHFSAGNSPSKLAKTNGTPRKKTSCQYWGMLRM